MSLKLVIKVRWRLSVNSPNTIVIHDREDSKMFYCQTKLFYICSGPHLIDGWVAEWVQHPTIIGNVPDLSLVWLLHFFIFPVTSGEVESKKKERRNVAMRTQ